MGKCNRARESRSFVHYFRLVVPRVCLFYSNEELSLARFTLRSLIHARYYTDHVLGERAGLSQTGSYKIEKDKHKRENILSKDVLRQRRSMDKNKVSDEICPEWRIFSVEIIGQPCEPDQSILRSGIFTDGK